MIPSSVRRAVASTPSGVLASSAPKTVAAVTPSFVRGHQRRCSSSKASRSDNGPNGVNTAADDSVTASSTTSTRHDGKRKRKNNKDAGNSFKKLPSVPSTHHMSQEALGLSSFFSLHRPISITQTMPRSVTDEHFASIFAPRTKANKISETISAFSDSIDAIEGSMGAITISAQEGQEAQDNIQRVELGNSDGSNSIIQLQIDAMSGEFLPFRPPPLPQSQVAESDRSPSEVVEEKNSTRSYNAMFTIEETTESNGQIRILAHSARIVDEEPPRTFLERLAQRQLRLDAARGSQREIYAISVQRQRKLKMKKKKYKKLMRKTRNERRKQGRT